MIDIIVYKEQTYLITDYLQKNFATHVNYSYLHTQYFSFPITLLKQKKGTNNILGKSFN